MDSPKPRLHLDRIEVAVMFGLFVIVAAMMFTLGVLVGHGLGAREGGAHLSPSTEHALHAGAHGDAHEEPEAAARKPASEEAAPAGNGLRKAFRDSKQQALVEMNLRDSAPAKPKSVLDNDAHLAAHSEWDRKPAASEEDSDAAARLEAARKAEEDREKAGVPKSVKTLFERAPGATDRFAPNSGSFTVQIASYATADESMAKVSQLRRAGFNEAYSETTKVKGGETWYRVGVGSFPTTAWASKAGEKLVKRKLAHDYVVRKVP